MTALLYTREANVKITRPLGYKQNKADALWKVRQTQTAITHAFVRISPGKDVLRPPNKLETANHWCRVVKKYRTSAPVFPLSAVRRRLFECFRPPGRQTLPSSTLPPLPPVPPLPPLPPLPPSCCPLCPYKRRNPRTRRKINRE